MAKTWKGNALLLALTLVFIFAIFELIVFRWVLVAADLPQLSENEGYLLKYEPNQSGVYRVKHEIKANYKINSNGWNSNYKSYPTALTPGKKRIVVIGDSYIEALQVNYDKSFAEQLEKILGRDSTEVFRFGMSGAPVSHYVYMLGQEAIKHSPHVVIINLVDNDFLQSLGLNEGTYTDSFATYQIHRDGSISDTEPKQYRRNIAWYIKRTATFRYLYVRMKLMPRLIAKSIMKNFYRKRSDVTHSSKLSNLGNYSVAQKSEIIIDYALDNLEHLQKKHRFELFLIVDGDRSETMNAIDENRPINRSGLWLNRLLSTKASLRSIKLLNLQDVIKEDYLENRKPFQFANDYHWNQYMHSLVAQAAKDYFFAM